MNAIGKLVFSTSLLLSVSFASASDYPPSPVAGTQRGPVVVLPNPGASPAPTSTTLRPAPLPPTSIPPPKGTVSGGVELTVPLSKSAPQPPSH